MILYVFINHGVVDEDDESGGKKKLRYNGRRRYMAGKILEMEKSWGRDSV